MTELSITCPICSRTSYNPNDVREGYCGNCHAFTGEACEYPPEVFADEGVTRNCPICGWPVERHPHGAVTPPRRT